MLIFIIKTYSLYISSLVTARCTRRSITTVNFDDSAGLFVTDDLENQINVQSHRCKSGVVSLKCLTRHSLKITGWQLKRGKGVDTRIESMLETSKAVIGLRHKDSECRL